MTSTPYRRGKVVASAVLAAFLVSGCGLLEFSIPIDTETTVQGGGLVGQLLEIGSFAGFRGLDLSNSQEFRNQGVDEKHIESVRLSALRLEILDPEDAGFDFLTSIAFHVESDGLEEKRVAFLDDIPANARVIELQIDEVDLAPYVVAESMSLTTRAVGRPPKTDARIGARAVFAVEAKVF